MRPRHILIWLASELATAALLGPPVLRALLHNLAIIRAALGHP